MFKYSEIYLKHHVLFTSIYLVMFFLIAYILNKISLDKFPFISRKLFVYASAALILSVFCWVTFVPRFGQIGRFPAIIDWLDRFFSGRFPYNSPITPSGFPFLFFISIPFYFIGNVGYLEVCGLILFLALAVYHSGTPKENLVKIIVLLMCPAFYYGFVVRDELFFNMMLPIVLLFLSDKYLSAGKINLKFILFGVLFGLALSTRSVVAVIYTIYLLYEFKTNIVNGIVFIIILSTAFGLLLLPFYLWDSYSFLHNGPFAVQSYLSHIPIWVVAVSIGLAVYLGWKAADLRDVLFSSGVILFLLVLISMLFQINQAGFDKAILNDVFDLSYFVFCIPFLLLTFKENKSLTV